MNKRYPQFIYSPDRDIVNGKMIVEYEIDNGRVLSPSPNYDFEKFNDSSQFEKRNWIKNIPFVSRLSFLENYTCEELYSSAIEELMDIEIPEIAKHLRVLMLELARIRGFFNYVFNVSTALEFEMARMWALSDINALTKLIDSIKDSEYFSPFIIPGGVKNTLSASGMNKVYEGIMLLKNRISDYDKLIFQNEIFRLRMTNVGIIPKESILAFGVTGFIARSANITFDVRKKLPYEIYGKLPIEVFHYEKSDAYSRILCRKNEIINSIQMIEWIFSNIPAESSAINKDIYKKSNSIRAGTSIKRAEGVNGEFLLFMESSGGECFKTVNFRSPVDINGADLLRSILSETSLDDLDLVLASLSLVPMEMNL